MHPSELIAGLSESSKGRMVDVMGGHLHSARVADDNAVEQTLANKHSNSWQHSREGSGGREHVHNETNQRGGWKESKEIEKKRKDKTRIGWKEQVCAQARD